MCESFEQLLDDYIVKFRPGQIVECTVEQVSDREVIVDLGGKQTGVISADDLTSDTTKKPAEIVKQGDVIKAIVIKVSDADGMITLSRKRMEESESLSKLIPIYESKEVVTGVVTNVVKGGVIVNINGARVFVPGSMTGVKRDGDLNVLKNKNVELIIKELDQEKSKVIGSIKDVKKARQAAAKAAFWETAEVGKQYEGTVTSIRDFGCFVDLGGGVDGLVHITELSWSRIQNPSEVVKVDDKITVTIKSLNQEKNRISLTCKNPDENPWDAFKAQYEVGSVCDAKIVSLTDFGAFGEIIGGVDGLIHVSEISNERVEKASDVLKKGDVVKVKITKIDEDSKRISLSMKALLETSEEAEDAE